MKKIKKCNNITNWDSVQNLLRCHHAVQALFLDIETTGLSPARSRLYLMGTAYLTADGLVTEQFFADAPDDEAALLRELAGMLERFDTIITFRGLGFDIPFLKGRAQRLSKDDREMSCIPDSGTVAPKSEFDKEIDYNSNCSPDSNPGRIYDSRHLIDLYKICSSYKNIFQLENYKLKTIETFLGVRRDDALSGAELAALYKDYRKHPDDETAHRMLQHNREDILGMVRLLDIYAFDRFFDGNFSITGCSVSDYRRMDGSLGKELTISCSLPIPLPAPISCQNSLFYLHGSKDCAILRVPLYEGNLKYFYPDYKNYYYLPEEDMAVHKSVAAYVDKSRRRKAAAADCYSRKAGIFAPQQAEVMTPALYEAYKAQVSYFELPGGSWEQMEQIKQASQMEQMKQMDFKPYCMHMLSMLKAGK